MLLRSKFITGQSYVIYAVAVKLAILLYEERIMARVREFVAFAKSSGRDLLRYFLLRSW